MTYQLQKELKVMKEEVIAMENIEKFMIEVGNDYEKYLKIDLTEDPYEKQQAFMQIVDDLKAHFGDTDAIEDLELDGEDRFYAIFGGVNQWYIDNELTPELKGVVEEYSGNPTLFASVQREGKKEFDHRIQELIHSIQDVIQIVSIVQKHGSNALFQMEATMMQLERLGIATSDKKSEDQQNITHATIAGLQRTQTKLEKALKKLEHAEHHHGIFSWLKDLINSLKNMVKKIAHMTKEICKGDFHAAKTDFNQLTDLKNMVHAMKDLFEHGNFKQAFELFATEALLYVVTGPLGMGMMNTKFGNDMHSIAKLGTDAVIAFQKVLEAGLAKAVGQKKFGDKLLKEDKSIGNDMLANPAIKPLMDVATITVIIACVAAQQYWLAAIMTTMLILSDTGGMSKIKEGLTKFVSDIVPGVSKDVAKMVADILVVVIVTALTMGTGSLFAAAEEGGEEAGDEAAEEGGNVVSKLAKKIGSKGGRALMGFGTSLGLTSLGADIARVADKKDKDLELILSIVQEVIAAVTAALGGIGMSSTVSEETSQITQGLKKVLPKLADYMEENAEEFTHLATKVQAGAMIAQGGGNAMVGGNQILQGEFHQAIQDLKAQITEFTAALNMGKAEEKTINDERKALVRSFDHIVNIMIEAPSLPIEGEYRAIMANA